MNNKITFIIPTVNRPTLSRTINSLINQKNPNWECIVIFDGVESKIFEDDRIKTIKIPKIGEGDERIGRAGKVRDYGIKICKTEWIGFLDDDDTLDPNYVDTLFSKYSKYDFVLWRMKLLNGKILPKLGDNNIKLNEVGISFCYKTNLFFDLRFNENVAGEDFYFLKKLIKKSKNFIITPEIFYFVRH
jgi:cellulose synthase/poly-beta-1,6-N-acetylglucosamine synthase-like glycosyltransferase